MFGLMPPDQSPLPTARPAASRLSVIVEGVEIEGSIRSQAPLRIDGTVVGRVEASNVFIGKSGEVDGVVAAGEVIVEGIATADIYAKRIVLKQGSTVTGSIFHEELQIEPAAFFEGKSRRVRNPQSLAPQAVEFEGE